MRSDMRVWRGVADSAERLLGMARRTAVLLVVWMSLLTLLALDLSLRHSATRSGEGNGRQQQQEQLDRELRLRDTPLELEKSLEKSYHLASVVKALLNGSESGDQRAGFEQVVALSSLLPRLTDVPRLKTPSPEGFRGYIASVGLPVVFTDMLEGSRLREWSWDYVRAKWGHQVFHNTRQGNYSSKKSTSGKYSVNRVSVTLADFIDVATGRRAPKKSEVGLYITKQRVIPPEDLEIEFSYPPFYPGPHKTCYLEPTAWIGAPGTFTQGHIDSKDNFAYHILGQKQWTIFPPTDYKYLYYIQRAGSLEWSTALNSLTQPDLKKFPLFAKATPITFTVSPGEVLYLPRGWTHTVRNLTPALMINTWRYGPAAITESWSERNRAEIRRKCFLPQQ